MRNHVRAVAFGLLLLLTQQGQAQGPAANQTELINRLLQRVDQLEKRVAELESGKPLVASAPVPATPEARTPAGMPGMDHGNAVDRVRVDADTTYPNLRIAGFSDINFSASQQPGTKSGFNEGQFILHLTSALSPRVAFFGELSMTARTDAGTGSPPAPGFNVEVERSIIRFDQSDALKLSFGRFHTPISYWNTAFHHGSWLQTTASRPESIQFGGSFIPVHFIGALAEGTLPSGGLNLNYNLGLGNGRGSALSRGGDFGDINNNKALLAGLYSKPNWLYGLQLGGSVYRDKINAVGKPETREWIESAHIVWNRENPEFIAEFFNVNHQRPGSSEVVTSQAWYAQAAWRLPKVTEWKPYFRYEHIHIPQADTVFRGTVAGVYGSTAGVRYDLSSFAAVKLEWRNQTRFGLKDYNGLWMQTSFTF